MLIGTQKVLAASLFFPRICNSLVYIGFVCAPFKECFNNSFENYKVFQQNMPWELKTTHTTLAKDMKI